MKIHTTLLVDLEWDLDFDIQSIEELDVKRTEETFEQAIRDMLHEQLDPEAEITRDDVFVSIGLRS